MPTIGVFVGHAAINLQAREVGAGVHLATHLGLVGNNAVVVDGRVGLNKYRFGVFARTYAVGNKGAEVERVFGRYQGGRTQVALHHRPAVEVVYVAVYLPLYLGAAEAVYIAAEKVKFELVVGAEVVGRFGRGLAANRGQIYLNGVEAGNHRVGFLIGEGKAISGGGIGAYTQVKVVGVANHGALIAAYHTPSKLIETAAARGQGFEVGAVAQANGRFFRHLAALYAELTARSNDNHFVGTHATVGVRNGEGHLGGGKERTGEARLVYAHKVGAIHQPSLGQPLIGVGFYGLLNPTAAQNLNAAAANAHIRTGIHLGRSQAVYGNYLRLGHRRQYTFFGRLYFGVDGVAAVFGEVVGVEIRVVVARIEGAVYIPTILGTVALVHAFYPQALGLVANGIYLAFVVAHNLGGVVAVKGAGVYRNAAGNLATIFVGYYQGVGGFVGVEGLDVARGFARAPQVGQFFAARRGFEFEFATAGVHFARHGQFGQFVYLNLHAVVGQRLAAALQVRIVGVVARFEHRRGVEGVALGAVGGHKVAPPVAALPVAARRVAAPNGLHVGENATRLRSLEEELTRVVAEGGIVERQGGSKRKVGHVERSLLREGIEAPVVNTYAVARAVEATVFNGHFELGRSRSAISLVVGEVAPRLGGFVVGLPTIGGDERIYHLHIEGYRVGIGKAARPVLCLTQEYRFLLYTYQGRVANAAGVLVYGRENILGVGRGSAVGGIVIRTVGSADGLGGRPLVGHHIVGDGKAGKQHLIATANGGVFDAVVYIHFRQREDGHNNAFGGNGAVVRALVVGGDLAIYAVAVVERGGGPRVGRGVERGGSVNIPLIGELFGVGVLGGGMSRKGYRVAEAGFGGVGGNGAVVAVVFSNKQLHIGRYRRNTVAYFETIGQRGRNGGRFGIYLGVFVGGFKDLAYARAHFAPFVGVLTAAAAGQAFELSGVANADFAKLIDVARADIREHFERAAEHNKARGGRVAAAVLVSYLQGERSESGETRGANHITIEAVHVAVGILGRVVANVGGHMTAGRGAPHIGVGCQTLRYIGGNNGVLVVNHHGVGVFGRVEGNKRFFPTIEFVRGRVFAHPYATFARYHDTGYHIEVVEVATGNRSGLFALQYAVDIPAERGRVARIANVCFKYVEVAVANGVAAAMRDGVNNRVNALNDVQAGRARLNGRVFGNTTHLAEVAEAIHAQGYRRYVGENTARVFANGEGGRMNTNVGRGVGGRTFYKLYRVGIAVREGVVSYLIPLVGEAAARGHYRVGGRVVFAGPYRVGMAQDTRLLIYLYGYRVFGNTAVVVFNLYGVGEVVVGLNVDGVFVRVAVGRNVGARPAELVVDAVFGVEHLGGEGVSLTLEEGVKFVGFQVYLVVNNHDDGVFGHLGQGAFEARGGADAYLVAVFEAANTLVAGKGHGVVVLEPTVFNARVNRGQRVGRGKEGHRVVGAQVDGVALNQEAVGGLDIHAVGVDGIYRFGNEVAGRNAVGTHLFARQHLALNGAPVGEAAILQRVGILLRQLHAVEIPFKGGVVAPVFALDNIGNGVEAANGVFLYLVAINIGEVGRGVGLLNLGANRVVAHATILGGGADAVVDGAAVWREEAYRRTVGHELGEIRRRRPRVGKGGIVRLERIFKDHLGVEAHGRVARHKVRYRRGVNRYGEGVEVVAVGVGNHMEYHRVVFLGLVVNRAVELIDNARGPTIYQTGPTILKAVSERRLANA